MDEKDAEIFRLKLKVIFLERFVFRQALLEPLSRPAKSSQATYEALSQSLHRAKDSGYPAFGLTGDPGLTALYGDEVARVYEELGSSLDSVYSEILTALKS